MTPSQQVKELGLESLAQVSRMTGVSPQTLDNWSKNKPKLFEIVLLGVTQKIDSNYRQEIRQILKEVNRKDKK